MAFGGSHVSSGHRYVGMLVCAGLAQKVTMILHYNSCSQLVAVHMCSLASCVADSCPDS